MVHSHENNTLINYKVFIKFKLVAIKNLYFVLYIYLLIC